MSPGLPSQSTKGTGSYAKHRQRLWCLGFAMLSCVGWTEAVGQRGSSHLRWLRTEPYDPYTLRPLTLDLNWKAKYLKQQAILGQPIIVSHWLLGKSLGPFKPRTVCQNSPGLPLHLQVGRSKRQRPVGTRELPKIRGPNHCPSYRPPDRPLLKRHQKRDPNLQKRPYRFVGFRVWGLLGGRGMLCYTVPRLLSNL